MTTMTTTRTLTFLSVALISSAWMTAAGDTVDLRSGDSLIGDVTELSDESVTIRVRFPTEQVRVVPRDEVSPRSLIELLAERAPPGDPAARLAIAEESVALGLFGHAVASFRQAAEIDPKLGATVERRIAEVEDRIASEVLDHARTALEEMDWATAKLNARVILDRYPNAAPADDARALIGRAMESMQSRSRPPRSKRQEKEVVRSLSEVEERLEKAAVLAEKTPSVGRSSKERRARERVVKILEGAWSELEELPMFTAGEAMAERAERLRGRVRTSLHDAYVGLGTLFVQRLALPSAERANASACRLDPESGGCTYLQGLIVQARITTGFGRRR